MNEEKYMKIALLQAKKALKKGEVPIGCVIVKNNKIISKAFNQKETKRKATAHAEIIAIEKACKKIKNWRLIDCELYCTMEPCMMCCGAILQSRIGKIIYGIPNQEFGNIKNLLLENSNIQIKYGICADECKKIVQDFFRKKRK